MLPAVETVEFSHHPAAWCECLQTAVGERHKIPVMPIEDVLDGPSGRAAEVAQQNRGVTRIEVDGFVVLSRPSTQQQADAAADRGPDGTAGQKPRARSRRGADTRLLPPWLSCAESADLVWY